MTKQSSASDQSTETAAVDNVQEISDAARSAANAAGREAKSLVGDTFLNLKRGARYTWHTYLGALVTAEEFAVSTTKGFAQRGADFEGQTREKINRQVQKANKSTEGLRQQARRRINDVESLIERGTDRSLHFLRVPTRGDVDQLTVLIEDLAEAVNELAEKSGGQGTKAGNARSKRNSSSGASATPA